MYFDLWYLISQYSDTDSRMMIQLVEKSAHQAVQKVPPLPRQISILIQNKKRSKLFQTDQQWMDYFKTIPFVQLCEPFAVSYKYKQYKFMTMITKACPKITNYFPVFFKEYNTSEEFFILLLSLFFKNEKCIQKCFRVIGYENMCLVGKRFFKGMKAKQRRQLQVYMDYSHSIGVDLTPIKNMMVNQ